MAMTVSELDYWVGKVNGYIEALNKRLNDAP
jgi:hypothetical protein